MEGETKKEVPGLVKVVSVLYYFLSASTVILAISSLYYFPLQFLRYILGWVYSITILFIPSEIYDISYRFIDLVSILGFVTLIIFFYFVAKDLAKGRKWAKNAVIVISILSSLKLLGIIASILLQLPLLVEAIDIGFIFQFLWISFGAIINIFIAVYFLFRERGKKESREF